MSYPPSSFRFVPLAIAAIFVLPPLTASAQSQTDQTSRLADVVSQHGRRLSRLEAHFTALRSNRYREYSSHSDRSANMVNSPNPATVFYRVKPGESLGQIARKNHTSTGELARLNKIKNPDRLAVGQLIQVPNPDQDLDQVYNKANHSTGHGQTFRGPVATAVTPDHKASDYVVQTGDTLFKIASSFGVTTVALREANGLFNDHIYVGQRLHLPGATTHAQPPSSHHSDNSSLPTPSRVTHQVQRHETSASIARQYGITIDKLARANGLADPGQIFVGQSLKIPSNSPASQPLDLGFNDPSKPTHKRNTPSKSDHFATYRVRKGDTVTGIARQFEVSPYSIREANDLDPDATIRIGQDLMVPTDQFFATLTPPN